MPDDINQNDKSCMEAAVRVVGNFYAVQMVQQHFGTLILDAELRESKEYDGYFILSSENINWLILLFQKDVHASARIAVKLGWHKKGR